MTSPRWWSFPTLQPDPGGDELVPPERQRKPAASIPGAEVFEVEGDHSACISRADLFVPALVEACRSVERRAGASSSP
jgi:hypothetical protein